ncbi:MAG: hypothetical protein AAGA48_11765 [Myxococcota bacterium]
MKTARLATVVPLALFANACTTQAVDDTINFSFDIEIEDVDFNCVENDSDVIEDKERSIGFTTTSNYASLEWCRVGGYYRGPVLSFQELNDSIPGGVREFLWTDVNVVLNSFDVNISNVDTVVQGSYFLMGAETGTESDIPTIENDEYGYDGGLAIPSRLAVRSRDGAAGTLFAAYTPNAGLSKPIALDTLVSLVGGQLTTEVADSRNLADVFNAAYASGDEDLYVFGSGVLEVPKTSLPKTPGDITIGVDMTLEYQANAKINLIGAAQSLNDE